jgi:hypothetical protein
MELMARGFWATGTVRKTRRGFPASLAGFPIASKPDRGDLVVRMHRDRAMCAIMWMDAKPMFLLSTACNPVDPNSYAGRWVGRERVDFPTSPILLQYQQFMRGVDLVDQQRQEYTVQLQSHKWWHRLFMFILDSTLLNSYILYSHQIRGLGLPINSRALWHYRLGMQLVGGYLQPNRMGGAARNLAPQGFHYLEGHPTARHLCVVCSKRTRRFCAGCGPRFMCAGRCYICVHTQPAYRARLLDVHG